MLQELLVSDTSHQSVCVLSSADIIGKSLLRSLCLTSDKSSLSGNGRPSTIPETQVCVWVRERPVRYVFICWQLAQQTHNHQCFLIKIFDRLPFNLITLLSFLNFFHIKLVWRMYKKSTWVPSLYSFDAPEQQCGQQTLLPVCEVPGHISPEVSTSQGPRSGFYKNRDYRWE